MTVQDPTSPKFSGRAITYREGCRNPEVSASFQDLGGLKLCPMKTAELYAHLLAFD
jgi:hypothetical protein